MMVRRLGLLVLGLSLAACTGGMPPGAGGSSSSGSGSSSSGGTPPLAQTCEKPTPWTVPSARQTVGSGTAASCTADALQKAVAQGGYVAFECGDAPVSIAVPAAIQVGKETVVDGGGRVTLDGGGTSQVFVVTGRLSVRNLRFLAGKAPQGASGGAVSGGWRSGVEVIGCTFEDNTASQFGGAVAVGTGSELVVVESRFLRNRSAYGGAIYSLWSPLRIVHSEFIDNSTFADSSGGAIGTDGALDPAFRNPQGGKDTVGGAVEICGSRFKNNRAQGAGGAAFLWVYPPDRIVIDRCTVEGNTVTRDSGGLAMGGGMRVSNGEITIKATSFLGNSADTHGGGLSLDCAPACAITNCTFHGNRATDGFGGAIFGDKLRVNHVTFAKNYAKQQGGGLFGGSAWEFRNSVFVDNEAGNPWGQAYSCAAKGTGDHVVQWVAKLGGAGSDPCVSGATAADPKLADPADNGGPTSTMLPGETSPLLGAGADCETTDQRGRPRAAAACDLGPVEVP